MIIIHALLGIVLLVLGRKLFWLFVGIVGFLYGILLGEHIVAVQSETTLLVIALLTGIIGAVAAIVLQKFFVAVAGFFAGGYLSIGIFNTLTSSQPGYVAWIPFLIGGIIGAVLVLLLFDWALIILSSLIGAQLLTSAFVVGISTESLLFFLFAIGGIIIQAGIMAHEQPQAV